ncbi:MAG: ATP-binding protein [Defluviitaleaceae bacterium]|nr:ATP-binding protein [Defluviitaleaceae bacterium]
MLFNGIKNKINAKILLINFAGVVTATALLVFFSSSMIRSSFQMRYEDRLQTPGSIFLAQYTYKDILPYVDRLRERDWITENAPAFLANRSLVLEAEANREGRDFPDEYHAAKKWLGDYVESLTELKDEKYFTIKRRMLELRVGTGLAYFYIFADLGCPDMYFLVFDATFQGGGTSFFDEDFGIPVPKSSYTEAERIFRTGEPVVVLNDPRHEHSENTYSFTPIKDEYGDVVAIIGTDINMQSLETQLRSFLYTSVTIIVIGSFSLLFVMYFALRGFVVRPIQKLTAISSEISTGNIEGEIPEWLINRKDEMGILGKSFASMSEALREMLGKNDALFEAAMSGRLGARGDPSALGGFFGQAADKINDTLDVIGGYFDNIPGALAILNADYDIVFKNELFSETFAGIEDAAVYRSMLETDDACDMLELKNRLADRLADGGFSVLIWFALPEGKFCLSFLCSLVTRDGKANGAIIVVTDSTELVAAKDKALSANKAKSEFLSRVSHELRTPLNVILSMAKLGLTDKLLEESSERFKKIVSSSSHLSDIINDVLEMSRIESGKMEIKSEPLNLKRVAMDCVELLSIRAGESGIELVQSIDPELPEVLTGDGFRIKQILINLLSNAVKFTQEGSVSLEVMLKERGADSCEVSFSVEDTGIGMSNEFLEKIFSPFEQEDTFLSRRHVGSGLGLSISYNLAGLMGGEMTVTSELGKGSRFDFTIPFGLSDSILPHEQGEESAREVSLEGKRLLLADDIEINRVIMLEVFEGTGVEITEARDGAEAFGLFSGSREGYFDCVLMDVQMPKMDGYSATAAIRGSGRSDSGVPVIAMTANALKEDIEQALSAGMDDHIAKPIDFETCIQKVSRWCEVSESRKAK